MMFKNKKVTVWIVGQFEKMTTEGIVWHMKGVYTSEKEAVKHCKNRTYFIGPVAVNNSNQLERLKWPGAYFPKDKEIKDLLNKNKEIKQ